MKRGTGVISRITSAANVLRETCGFVGATQANAGMGTNYVPAAFVDGASVKTPLDRSRSLVMDWTMTATATQTWTMMIANATTLVAATAITRDPVNLASFWEGLGSSC